MNTKTSSIVVALVVVVLLFLGLYGYVQNQSYTPVTPAVTTSTGTTPTIQQVVPKNTPTKTGVPSIPAGSQTVSSVKIALLVDPVSTSFHGAVAGCDRITMADRSVLPTATPINAAMNALFTDTTIWPPVGAVPGNFIHSQLSLSYDHLTVDGSGVARVYLLGKVVLSGECDNPRIKNQVTSTLMQFPSVKSVVFYLNGVQNDFNFSLK